MYFIFSYLNTLDVLTLDKLSKESLEIFLESRILGNYVATDFKNDFSQPGETVIATYPAELTADRLPERGTKGISDAVAGSHSITLNQHLHVTLNFYDREKIRSEKDLINMYMAPMARALAQKYDRTIQGELMGSYLYTAGALGTDLDYDQFVDAGMLMTENNVPVNGRNVIVGPRLGAQIRKADGFVGDLSLTDSSLIRTGVIGQIGGFLVSETNSFAAIAESTTVVDVLINNASGYAIGDSVLVVDGHTGTYAAGFWVKIGGIPYRTTAKTDNTGNLVGITVEGGLRKAAANNDVVTLYTYPLVNLVAGYDAGYEGAITYDGGVTPKVGQGVTFGTTGDPYTVVKVDSTTIWLNRPLDAAIANDAPIFLMPGGNYGVAITPNSIQVVTRPLPPANGGGVVSSTAVGENFSIRVQTGYDILTSREIITMDCIMGVANHFPEYNVLLLG